MEWLFLEEFTLTENWQLTANTDNTCFKLKHTISSYSSQDSMGLIALINDEVVPIEIFEIRRILPRLETEIVKFTKIPGWNYKLAVKQIKLPNKPLLDWKINVQTIQIQESMNLIQAQLNRIEAKIGNQSIIAETSFSNFSDPNSSGSIGII